MTSALFLIASSLLAPAPRDGCDGNKPRVMLVLSGWLAKAQPREELAAYVRGGLTSQGIDICTKLSAADSLRIATVLVDATSNHANVRVQLKDEEQPSEPYPVNLRRIPSDTKPVSVAIVVEELLAARQTRLEILREQAAQEQARLEAKQRRLEEEQERAQQERLRLAALAHRFFLGAALHGRVHAQAKPWWGGHLEARYSVLPNVAVRGSVGGSKSVSYDSVNGTVDAWSLQASLLGEYTWLRRETWSVASGAGLELIEVFWSSTSSLGEAQSQTTTGLNAVVDVVGRVSLASDLELFLAVGGGAPLKTVTITDESQSVTSTRRVLVTSSIGAAWRW